LTIISEIQDIAILRQQESVPILEGLKQWMIQQYPQVVPQSNIARAIAYSLERWDKLSIYTREGNLMIDNNPVENSIRPVAERITYLPVLMKLHSAVPCSTPSSALVNFITSILPIG
jgi:hypothetical protein